MIRLPNTIEVKMKIMRLSRAQARTVGAYKRVFESDDGRAVLIDLMRRAEMTGMPSPKKEPTDWAFAEGKRACVLEILQMLGIDEQKSLELYKEGAE